MTAVILALIAGAVVGLALGGLGGGGGILAVPALIYLLGFTPAAAGSASLLIVAATSLTGLLAHARSGRVQWRTGLLFAAAGLPTAAAFGALSPHVPGTLLTMAFAVLAGLAAWRMLAPRRATTPDRKAGVIKTAGIGACLGGVTGLLGVGGGFLAVPALISILALTMAEAVGTSLLVISINSVAALIPRLGSDMGIDWAVVGPFTGAAILGAFDGKRLAHKLSGPVLQRTFVFALLGVAAFMALDVIV
ncbi:sulfite exporter TauE/SafE family protein [Streptomyces sannanensis]|uniref:Probable membrane transporter protein n=1 Tax=Streptomyces sannanensis TaxID=285536 RepID=A0ABP6SNX9_9ACTN